MINIEELAKQARKLKGCKGGVARLRQCKNEKDLMECFYDYIDYCIAKGFPSRDELLTVSKNIRHSAGIYVDESLTIHNPCRMVLIDSTVHIRAGGYNVCRAYVVGRSKLHVESSGNAITMIDALGESEVTVVANDPSRVIVNLYGNAKCEGATKVNAKELETYEL